LRKIHGSRLNIFAPANDLSALSKTGSESRSLLSGQDNDVAISGGRILGDEYSEHILRVSLWCLFGMCIDLYHFASES
jgi:hypothetical protein